MKIQLQSILLPCEAVCTVQELYFHEKDDRADFDGYFNLFYIEKRKAYTNIAGLYLTARITGYSRLILMHNREKIREMELNHDQKEYVVEFPYQEYSDGVFWFSLIKRPGEVKQEISADRIVCRGDEIYLDIGKIYVNLGNQVSSDQIAQIPPILEKLGGQEGTLHLENYSESSDTITFDIGEIPQ